MKCAPSLRLTPTAVVALAALLATSLTSSIVRGECGDYVIVGRPLLNSNELSPALRVQIAIYSAYSHNGLTDHRGSTPCHGPSCSRRDPVPVPSVPTAVVTTNATDWAFLITGMPLREFGFERFRTLPRLQLTERLPTPIERPPRVV